MAKRNRETLKNYFKKGNRPSEQEFMDLVDSSLNILDDGFSKEPETGIEISPLFEKETLISFFREAVDSAPQWEIAIEKTSGSLLIKKIENEKKTPLLTLRTDGSVALGEKEKEILLQGTLQMPVRQGSLLQGEVPADGRWHDLEELDLEGNRITKAWMGCQALEIVASVSIEGSGKHAILVANATVCFGRHSKIRKMVSYYGSYGNKICLRWKKLKTEKHAGKLQMKTILKYGNDAKIQYHIGSLFKMR